jgi:hypothetical protein
MSEEQVSIFPENNSETQEEEKPKRRRGRPRKNVALKDEEQQQEKVSSFDGKALGEATANLLNAVAANLPERWFEKKELSEVERNVTIESVSAIAATVEQEKVSRFARTLPLLAIGVVIGAVFLSRLKRRTSETTGEQAA